MDWEYKVIEKCKALNVEPSWNNQKIVFRSAETLDLQTKTDLSSLLPAGMTCKFQVGPKEVTIKSLNQIIAGVPAEGDPIHTDKENRKIIVELRAVPQDHPLWEKINEILNSDGFFKSWEFKTADKDIEINPHIRGEIEKNVQARERILTDDDLMNLKISLGKVNTVEDFLASF